MPANPERAGNSCELCGSPVETVCCTDCGAWVCNDCGEWVDGNTFRCKECQDQQRKERDGMNDKQKRDKAIDVFAGEMKKRMDWAAEVKGYNGWDNEYPADALRKEILLDVATMIDLSAHNKAVDIANRCMMLWLRDQAL